LKAYEFLQDVRHKTGPVDLQLLVCFDRNFETNRFLSVFLALTGQKYESKKVGVGREVRVHEGKRWI
jgi:hypothetical protein